VNLDFSVAVRDLPLLLQGLWVTAILTLAGTAIALTLGQALAFLRLSPVRPLRWIAGAYIDFVRGTPLLIQLFALYFGAPQLGLDISPMAAGILGLGLNGAAYMAEILRSGILSVDPGQREAAKALGMGPVMTLRRVILPQAYRIAIPPLTGAFVALLKDTSLVSTITVVELTRQAQTLIGASYRAVELYTAAAVLYFVLTYPLLKLADFLERRLSKGQAAT
jgi:His/Glu/Gln/Arg/opine family amino acid ABC transporter permease subunit